MLEEPTCSKRDCIFFIGVRGKNEMEEHLICEKYKPIPTNISYGTRKCPYYKRIET